MARVSTLRGCASRECQTVQLSPLPAISAEGSQCRTVAAFVSPRQSVELSPTHMGHTGQMGRSQHQSTSVNINQHTVNIQSTYNQHTVNISWFEHKLYVILYIRRILYRSKGRRSGSIILYKEKTLLARPHAPNHIKRHMIVPKTLGC